jgi:hypothetical protein
LAQFSVKKEFVSNTTLIFWIDTFFTLANAIDYIPSYSIEAIGIEFWRD